MTARTLLKNLTLVLLLVALDVAALPRLEIGSGQVDSAPATVQVPLRYERDNEVVAIQLEILFDESALTAERPYISSPAEQHIVRFDASIPGLLRLVIFNKSNEPLESGTLIEVPFVVNELADEGSYPLIASGVRSTDALSNSVPTFIGGGVVVVASDIILVSDFEVAP